MKKFFFLAFLLSWLAVGASAQTYVLTVTETDGVPRKTGITTLVFQPGQVTISGARATISGGGMAVGQPVTGGGSNRVLYTDNSGNLKTTANFAYVETSGALVVTPSSVGTGILVQGGASPINGISNLGTNSGLLEFGAASGVAAFTPLAQPGDGIIRNSSATGGNGNLILVNNNSGFVGDFIWSTGALGSDTEKARLTQAGRYILTPGASQRNTLTVNHTDGTLRHQSGVLAAATTFAALWLGNVTASDTNYTLSSDGATVLINAASNGSVAIRGASATNRFNYSITNETFAIGSGATIGTSGTRVLAILGGTAPTTSPVDEGQIYVGDAAAGDAQIYMRNEAGLVNRQTGLCSRVSTQFDSTNDATLSDIPGLSINVEAGRSYRLVANIFTTSGASGGVQFAIAGTATATSIIYEAFTSNAGTVTQGRATTLGTTVGGVNAVTVANGRIEGTIVVNAAGTLTVQAAQNTSNGTTTSVLVNSNFCIAPIG